MKEIEQIVLRAADPSSPLAARREAFGELVIRFQDMAFGCAFAVLGDVYLAQDTAQEAFVVAWQRLAQLREPAAFPGWFKRIVLTQCNGARSVCAARLQRARSVDVDGDEIRAAGRLLHRETWSGIVYAQTHGYHIVQTFNKPEQEAIRALNAKLGFEVLFENLTLEKCLRDVIEVEPQIYDEFVGRYRDDSRPDLEIVVRNEAGRLTAECVGQKVELFPASESNYFVKQFYGEVSFHRDCLDFEMRVPNSEPSDPLHARKIS